MRRVLLILTSLAALVAGACGGSDDASSSFDRSVTITMRDIAYAPEAIDVRQGETIRFTFVNDGKLTHDAFIGDEAAQEKHERGMRDDSGTHHMHGDADAVSVAAGKRGQLTKTFDAAGVTYIGCHEAGHYDAGMRIAVTVAPK